MRLIDADWLLDVVENIIDWDTERDKNRIIHQVRELTPPVDTEPKRGKWISADAIFGGVPFYCSECGENTRDTVMGEPRWNYCPMCGAKMEVTE